MMELLLTRHGETLENKRDIMQGHIPGTLSLLGIQQAEHLADALKNEKLDAIISSDLARSYDTAKIVGQRRGLEPRPTVLLREIDWGEYTGGRLSAIDWEHLPAGCESLGELMKRAEAFVAWLCAEYPDRVVLAVGHGVINRAIIAFLEKKTTEEMIDMPIMKNTSVVRLQL